MSICRLAVPTDFIASQVHGPISESSACDSIKPPSLSIDIREFDSETMTGSSSGPVHVISGLGIPETKHSNFAG